jgi:DNA repair protein RecN (Recombination protein N)
MELISLTGLWQNLNCRLKVGVVSATSSLTELSIKSLGVIESAEVELSPGFTVLTGETGAGKTMVLTALGLILGAKSDSDFVRHGAERLSVSARFALSDSLSERASELGAEIEDGEVVITRQVTNQGKSKALLGGVPSTASAISELGSELVEIHGQSTSGRITKPAVVRELLDNYAKNAALLKDYQFFYASYVELRARIKELKATLADRDQEISTLQEFAKDFERVSPQPNELSEVENEISRLSSVETISSEVTIALTSLSDEEFSALNALGSARKSLDTLRGKDSELDLIIDRFLDAQYAVSESSAELSRYLATLEANPSRFEYLQNRKSELAAILKKYGKGSDREEAYSNILLEGAETASRVKDLQGGDRRIAEMESELAAIFSELTVRALRLSESRQSAATKLGAAITAELSALSMPHAQVKFELAMSDPTRASDYSAYGIDEISITFRSHSAGSFLPVGKSASGGELSRVMLAIEVVLAGAKSIGTYIFDEVDAGVGGKAAVEVGRRLALLAKSAQVIVVTHLAQVAVWADTHLVVAKSEDGLVVRSGLRQVVDEERKVEIARLLSGQEDSASAQEHAAELLDMVAQSVIS